VNNQKPRFFSIPASPNVKIQDHRRLWAADGIRSTKKLLLRDFRETGFLKLRMGTRQEWLIVGWTVVVLLSQARRRYASGGNTSVCTTISLPGRFTYSLQFLMRQFQSPSIMPPQATTTASTAGSLTNPFYASHASDTATMKFLGHPY
jgi:hypothetical protein